MPQLKSRLSIPLQRLWTVMLVAVVLTGSAVGFSLFQKPVYEASIKILVGQETTDPLSLASEVEGLQQLTLTLADTVTTRRVAQAVVEQLDLPTGSAEGLLKNVSVQQNTNSMLIEVSYKDTDPKRAQMIANAFGQVFSNEVSEVSPSASSITATVWDRAVLPEVPVSPHPLRNGILALALGMLLGVGLAFLLEHLDDSWNSPEEVEQASGLPTFGVIPEFEVSARMRGER